MSENTKTILVITAGTLCDQLGEVLSITNPEHFKLFENNHEINKLRTDYGIKPVDEMWVLNTESGTIKIKEGYLEKHNKCGSNVKVKWFYPQGYEKSSIDECNAFRELAYRAMLHAVKEAGGKDNVIASLIGGQKNMSADLQDACNIFGCHVMLHIVSNGKLTIDLKQPLSADNLKLLIPFVIFGKINQSVLLYENNISAEDYPLQEDGMSFGEMTPLYDEIKNLKRQSEIILTNYSHKEDESAKLGNFRNLSGLHPKVIKALKDYKIGADPAKEEHDMEILRMFPKAELHCHFGGILSPAEMIETAKNSEKKDMDYFHRIVELVKNNNIQELIKEKNTLVKNKHSKGNFEKICAFLSAFENKSDLLDRIIYYDCYSDGNFDEGKFRGLQTEEDKSIKKYEQLGDLQGSSLMQSENCIKKACEILLRRCRENNVKYIEVRCSPYNYAKEGLTGEEVVKILLDNLTKDPEVSVSLIFIASRHRNKSEIYRHIELVQDILSNKCEDKELQASFAKSFAGFDLAGDEKAQEPKSLQGAFESLFEKCVHLTIHAGETAKAKNIWEAVYYLNADRIGHGLQLLDNKETDNGENQPEHNNEKFVNRLLDRRIALELCPSSNYQILKYVNYAAGEEETDGLKKYPLKEFMEKGLRATINTDNPGISRTDFTREYYMAAKMTDGGLSLWDILQLIKNSFSSTFNSFEQRRKLMLAAEKEIMEIITDKKIKDLIKD